MSKLESFILISFTFILFVVVFVRFGFLLNHTISNNTILYAATIYSAIYFTIISLLKIKNKNDFYLSGIFFLFFLIVSFFAGKILANTFDTSWDGQGYHQTAVIALANNWNPIFQPEIQLKQRLPSQIFAEGYPSAIWEVQATVYALIGRVNSAKVINLFFGVLAFFTVYSLNRKIKMSKIVSLIVSFLIVTQPVYTLQFLTFMQDGVGYQILLITVAALAIMAFSANQYWAILTFILGEIMLVSSKYSHLPLALVLGIIFGLIVVNRFLNKIYKFGLLTNSLIIATIILSLIFASLPYVRNTIYHRAPFYPTNIPDLMGSVKYNNLPNNIENKDKLSLLFYGIFSRAQQSESGDPRNKANVANLKIPFTFTLDEIKDSAELYNNRVGAGGPLFSGIVLVCAIFLSVIAFKAKNQNERYAIYISIFSLLIICTLAVLVPTPNLLRYANQVQLIPFAILIPILGVFKNNKIKIFIYTIFIIIGLNNIIYMGAVVQRQKIETQIMKTQFDEMKKSNIEYQVGAQQFYSNYILLDEQEINFVAVDRTNCKVKNYLHASSSTTQYCAY